jgi:aspartyl-tRNA(Asn)/glutamyl-tRNA(Gln) amidotransferase subunit A
VPAGGLRIGMPKEFFGKGCRPTWGRGATRAEASTKAWAPRLVAISLPRTELSIPVYYIIAPAEASSNLSRFDGVKFGHRARSTATCSTCTRRRAPRVSATR